MDFKGNRHELRLSLLEAFTSYLAFCQGCTGIEALRETLDNPHTRKVNAYKVGKTDDLYYEERLNNDGLSGLEYRMVRATEGGWAPCFPGPGDGWSFESPKGRPDIKWGYWRVPVACARRGGKVGAQSSEIKRALPNTHAIMAVEMTKIIISRLRKYRRSDGENEGEYGGEIIDFFADESHVENPLWDLYLEAFGLCLESGYSFPDSGRISSRLCVLMDRFHGNVERRIAY